MSGRAEPWMHPGAPAIREGPAENVGQDVTAASHCTVLREGQAARRKSGESGCWLHFFDPSSKTLGVCATTDHGGRDHTLVNQHRTLGGKETYFSWRKEEGDLFLFSPPPQQGFHTPF